MTPPILLNQRQHCQQRQQPLAFNGLMLTQRYSRASAFASASLLFAKTDASADAGLTLPVGAPSAHNLSARQRFLSANCLADAADDEFSTLSETLP